jgi:hypothetical protein
VVWCGVMWLRLWFVVVAQVAASMGFAKSSPPFARPPFVPQGSNNVFVPTRASRLTFGMWANSENIAWNNWWASGHSLLLQSTQ